MCSQNRNKDRAKKDEFLAFSQQTCLFWFEKNPFFFPLPLSENPRVGGSIPSLATFLFMDLTEKICSGCGQAKAEDQFDWKYQAKGIRRTRCKTCMSIYSKRHYLSNKEIYKKRGVINGRLGKHRLATLVYKYLEEHSCVDCGQSNPLLLDFDHRNDKFKSISEMIKSRYSWDKIKEEISKCDVRCANCHRMRTAKQFGWKRLLLAQADRIVE
jgi:hypothetical protein